MKRPGIVICLFSLLAMFLYNCQSQVDVEAEKEAILAVIQAESESARDGDYEKLISLYIQDDLQTRLNLGSESYSIQTGWDELGPLFERYKDPEVDRSGLRVSKENPVIKVTGNTAWIICDNIWEGEVDGEAVSWGGLQVTFLEKVEGEWKFSFAAWLRKPEPPEEAEEPEAEEEPEAAEE